MVSYNNTIHFVRVYDLYYYYAAVTFQYGICSLDIGFAEFVL